MELSKEKSYRLLKFLNVLMWGCSLKLRVSREQGPRTPLSCINFGPLVEHIARSTARYIRVEPVEGTRRHEHAAAVPMVAVDEVRGYNYVD